MSHGHMGHEKIQVLPFADFSVSLRHIRFSRALATILAQPIKPQPVRTPQVRGLTPATALFFHNMSIFLSSRAAHCITLLRLARWLNPRHFYYLSNNLFSRYSIMLRFDSDFFLKISSILSRFCCIFSVDSRT